MSTISDDFRPQCMQINHCVDHYRCFGLQFRLNENWKDAIDNTKNRQPDDQSFSKPIKTPFQTAQRQEQTEKSADELLDDRRTTVMTSREGIYRLCQTETSAYKLLCCQYALWYRLEEMTGLPMTIEEHTSDISIYGAPIRRLPAV